MLGQGYNKKMNRTILLGVAILVVVLLGAIVLSIDSKPSSTTLGSQAYFTDLSPSDFNRELVSGKFKLLDVRTVSEYLGGHIKGAAQKDYYQTQQFSDYLDSLDKKANYLIYCRTGHRSSSVLKIMQQKGFTNVYDLSGGINAWISEGFPVEK